MPLLITQLVVFPLLALAVARVSGIITADRLTDKLRHRLARRWCGNDPEQGCDSLRAYLITCQWCCSVWIGLALAVDWYLAPDAWWTLIGLGGLAASQITGMISNLGRG